MFNLGKHGWNLSSLVLIKLSNGKLQNTIFFSRFGSESAHKKFLKAKHNEQLTIEWTSESEKAQSTIPGD